MSGRVLLGGAPDSVPLGGAWVVLHEVSPRGGAPVDSVRTDPGGRYRVGIPVTDTTAIYLVSVGHHEISYFSRPIHPGGRADTAEALVVFDTSAVGPAIFLAQRHVAVREPEPDGGRRAIELLVLENRGTRTRIAADTLHPVWWGLLPPGVVAFEVGESDVSAQAVFRRGDTLIVVAPMPPGEKQLVVTYVLPRAMREFSLPVNPATDLFNVLLEDTAATLVAGPLELREKEVMEDVVFARYEARGVPSGAEVTFRFGRSARSAAEMLGFVVGIATAVLLLAVLLWMRRKAAPAEDPERIAAEIADLDRQAEAQPPAAGAGGDAYRKRRAALKARLEAALAVRPKRP